MPATMPSSVLGGTITLWGGAGKHSHRIFLPIRAAVSTGVPLWVQGGLEPCWLGRDSREADPGKRSQKPPESPPWKDRETHQQPWSPPLLLHPLFSSQDSPDTDLQAGLKLNSSAILH